MNPEEFNIPSSTDVFEEIARTTQQITVKTLTKRYGKKTTVVEGFDKHVDVKSIGKSLKEKLACGGTVKNGIVELQGDHKKKIKSILIDLGFSEDSITD